MKALLKILGSGFVAFMILAIGQEWDFFSAAWFGGGQAEPVLAEADRNAASEALYVHLRVSSHFYASGGDPRFAERMLAGESVLAGMRSDVEYLRRNSRLQEPQLVQLEVVSARLVEPGSVELRTREWWFVRTRWLATGSEAEPGRALKSFGRYLLVRGPQGWQVEGWEPLDADPAPTPEPAAPPPPSPTP